MNLIVGLGNPGVKYQNTKHNIGFICLDYLSKDGIWETHKKTDSQVIKTSRFLLAKPQTFMNLSGQAVSSLLSFFKLQPNDLIVIHDDLDLDFGRIKIQDSGQSAGHKGLESIINFLNTENFLRIRVGIGRPNDPKIPVEDYVLSNFSENDKPFLEGVKKEVKLAVETIIKSGKIKALNLINSKRVTDAKH